MPCFGEHRGDFAQARPVIPQLGHPCEGLCLVDYKLTRFETLLGDDAASRAKSSTRSASRDPPQTDEVLKARRMYEW
jgi:hypothetical protein